MELQGTHQFKAPLESVWDALMNPTILAKALPGGDQLERVGENDYKAAMNVKVGPVQGRFEGKVTLTDVVLRDSYRMKVSGTGAAGFVNGEGAINLVANDEGTLMSYSGDVQIGGRIAAVGQRLIDSTAKAIIRQGLKTLDEQLVTGSTPAAPEAPNPKPVATPDPSPVPEPMLSPELQSPSTPASTFDRSSASVSSRSVAPTSPEPPAPGLGKMAVEIARDIAQDLASDYIPREKQPQAFAFILGALAMLLFVMLVRAVQRD